MSSSSQLRALLRKNYQIKRAQCCQTSCELLSPLLITWLLVGAYHLFQDFKQVIPAEVYVNQKLNNPELATFLQAASEMEFYV
eukprot:CAMPEP_0197539362 /NCGR_PEP_ID=MMETSP1318-20131121/62495_1 /TAXON_ID=552666 /ORGANISM="Partenskyella glossopodia, Strain RCC365" /LENGTH=82 /DNA_ID=CAMNT_0043098055 /DNA_START=85 /DNA_END=329 /DNA_ORIENTATION=-